MVSKLWLLKDVQLQHLAIQLAHWSRSPSAMFPVVSLLLSDESPLGLVLGATGIW